MIRSKYEFGKHYLFKGEGLHGWRLPFRISITVPDEYSYPEKRLRSYRYRDLVLMRRQMCDMHADQQRVLKEKGHFEWFLHLDRYWLGTKISYDLVPANKIRELCNALRILWAETMISTSYTLCRDCSDDFKEWWDPNTFVRTVYPALPVHCKEHRDIWEPYYAAWKMQYEDVRDDNVYAYTPLEQMYVEWVVPME